MPAETLSKTKAKKGLKVEPRFCLNPSDSMSSVEWEIRHSVISNPDVSVVFKAENIRIPKGWSQVATDIIAQKYFRRAGVPMALMKVEEEGVPVWIQRSVPDQAVLTRLPESERF